MPRPFPLSDLLADPLALSGGAGPRLAWAGVVAALLWGAVAWAVMA